MPVKTADWTTKEITPPTVTTWIPGVSESKSVERIIPRLVETVMKVPS